MHTAHKYLHRTPLSTLARVAFAIAITLFVVVFEWADLKAGREAKAIENSDF